MTFVGRAEERGVLERAYESAGSAFVPVYGRRRVGKSELLARFAAGKPSVFFVGKQARADLQKREILKEAAAALGEPLLLGMAADGWKEILTAIVDRHAGPRKLVLILDEFQWTVEASPELPSILQELWDRKWRASGRVLLILCGSYLGFMERDVLGEKSPLFGRRTAQILLRPFGYREAALFHPGWSWSERARAYFVCGGVPAYLSLFDPGVPVDSSIVSLILDPHGPLRHEPDFLLREELRGIESYHGILTALAGRSLAPAEIGRATGLGASVHYHLAQLVTLGYAARRQPLSGRPARRTDLRYVLADPLLRFWFRFVFPNGSLLEYRGAAETFRQRIRPDLTSYMGTCFEDLCREALPWLYAEEGVTAPFRVGEYWDAGVQIDVVGVREDGWIDLGECKWGAVRSTRVLVEGIDRRAEAFPNPRNATVARRLFVARRPPRRRGSSGEGRIRFHDLGDLYAGVARR